MKELNRPIGPDFEFIVTARINEPNTEVSNVFGPFDTREDAEAFVTTVQQSFPRHAHDNVFQVLRLRFPEEIL